MRDIIITGEIRKKELRILLICFAISFLINIAAIIIYRTPWIEMFSQIGYVLVIGLVLYLTVTLIRLLLRTIRKLFKKR